MESAGEELGHCLVTGAAGFLGSHLVEALLGQGCRVRGVIRNTPLALEHPLLETVKGVVEDQEVMRALCEGIDTVFHTAANVAILGGSGVTDSYRDAAFTTNLEGTKNVIAACQDNGVKRLVHTSSIDVCFNSEENVDMNEHTPYATNLTNLYTETKILAEQAVLAANGEGGLLTTALRPDGIYGAGNNIMLDEIFEQVTSGRLVATIGGAGGLHEHIFVDNLVHAEILLAKHLKEGNAVCGKAYFVTDGHRAPMFEFFAPLIEALGYRVPSLNIPAKPMMAFGAVWQYLHFKLGLPEPLLSPHAVAKLTISHCATNEAAARDFGYAPIKTAEEALAACIDHYQRKLGEIRGAKSTAR